MADRALLDAAKELREAVAAYIRAIDAYEERDLAALVERELMAAGVKDGFGVRAQKAIAQAEKR